MGPYTLGQRLGAEFLGTAVLLATVIGSGIMGAKLSAGNDALALLGNTLLTGAILVVLITVFGPVSGAHFIAAQLAGAVLAMLVAGWLFYPVPRTQTDTVLARKIA